MIEGSIQKILTQKDNDWGRYLLKKADNEEIMAVGIIPGASLGMTVLLEGYEVTNEYGHQFKIKTVISSQEDVFGGIRQFLAGGYLKGIGMAKATDIISTFGKETLTLFETESGRERWCEVKGITRKTIDKIMPYYEENKKYIPILMFLNGAGTKNQIEKIYQKYGEDTTKVLKSNPYQLEIDISGFGFKKVDEMAMKSGYVKKTSISRVMAGTKYLLENASVNGGHCFLMKKELIEEIKKLLVPLPKHKEIEEKKLESAVKSWDSSKERFIKDMKIEDNFLAQVEESIAERAEIEVVFDEAIKIATEKEYLVEEEGRVYTRQMYDMEVAAAKMIVSMCKKNPVRKIDEESLMSAIREVEDRKTRELRASGIDVEFKTTEEQMAAVRLGTMNRVAIVSGGPGRGKTAISEEIAQAFLKSGRNYDLRDVIMLAPTGRAAMRIKESTGYEASTIQRAILQKEIPSKKLILVDEFSMVDIYMFVKLLKYAKDCNIIIVGDINQIASVGPGKVLADLIASGVLPYIILKQGHRNSGTIALNSDKINEGKSISTYEYDEHFVYHPESKETIAAAIINDYKENIQKYGIQNVLLCTAMRERGVLAVNSLNKKLQQELTSGNKEAVFGKKLFREGDRVMQIKNDYEFIVKRPTGLEKGIFNGEKGTIIKIQWIEEEKRNKMIVLFDDGSMGGYGTEENIDKLELAYVTTLHKCQGSEAPCTMIGYSFADYMLMNRSLFYTGETRAKKVFHFYGEEKVNDKGRKISAFDIAVRKTDDEKRNTYLAERIKEEYALR